MTNQQRAMVDLIRELVPFLLQDQLTVEEVMAKAGQVVSDPGVPMPMELQPALPGVDSAQLGRYPDTGLPYVLTLEPSTDARPTAGALKAVLGNFKRTLTGRGMPVELIFPPADRGSRWRVVVMVSVGQVGGDLESAPVTSIAFRRDPVTR